MKWQGCFTHRQRCHEVEHNDTKLLRHSGYESILWIRSVRQGFWKQALLNDFEAPWGRETSKENSPTQIRSTVTRLVLQSHYETLRETQGCWTDMVAFWSTLVNILQLTVPFLGVKNSKFIPTSPASCLNSSTTIDALVTCLEVFIVPTDYYNQTTYETAQPTSNQRDDWKSLIKSFLSVQDGNCSSIPIPLSLQGIYTVEAFNTMCVLYETSIEEGVYLKGWGFMVAPGLRTSVSRAVHFSAPHPIYDRETVQQAAFLFESTGSQSLLVAGRTRAAFSGPSECIPPVSPSQRFYKTDSAHNDVCNVTSSW